MMRIKKALSLLLLIFIAAGVYAQTPDVLQRLNSEYNYVGKFADSLAVVNKGGANFGWRNSDGLFGYVDYAGDIVVPLIYNYASTEFRNGFAIVGMGSGDERKFGLIDRRGQEIVKCVWDEVSAVSDGMTVVHNGTYKRTYSLIDTLGREVKLSYDYCGKFSDGLAAVGGGSWADEPNAITKEMLPEFTGKKGFIDRDANVVIPLEYDEVKGFYDGMAPVGKQGKYYIKWGAINKKGETVIPFDYYSVGYFCNGLALVCKVVSGGRLAYGYIDKSGVEVIECKYDIANDFEFDNVWVGMTESGENIYSLIDKTGTALIAFKVYDLDDSGKYGHAVVATKDAVGKLLYGLVDNRGRVVIPFEYDEMKIFSEWDAASNRWIERGIVVKDGKNNSFSLSKK